MFAFKLIMTKLHEYQNCESTDMFEPLRLIIAGTAGCGKYYLIKYLVKAIRLFYNFNKSVQRLFFTILISLSKFSVHLGTVQIL
jgi:hypothetical protein